MVSALSMGSQAEAPALSAKQCLQKLPFRPKNRRKPQSLATALKARVSGWPKGMKL